jgi:hypothetical protein
LRIEKLLKLDGNQKMKVRIMNKQIPMSKHQEYSKNLQKEKWVKVMSSKVRNCQHPGQENITCGEYEKGTFWLTPVGGNQVVVPVGYTSRSGL